MRAIHHPPVGAKRYFSDTWKDEPEILTIQDKAIEKIQKLNEKQVTNQSKVSKNLTKQESTIVQ